MPVDFIDKDSKDNFDVWIGNILKDSETCIEEVSNELADLAVEDTERKLLSLKRKGKLPSVRGVHMHQDVKKVKSKKYGYISIGGGEKTATLYHIINDGTYKNFATHFLDQVVRNMDSQVDNIWDKRRDL